MSIFAMLDENEPSITSIVDDLRSWSAEFDGSPKPLLVAGLVRRAHNAGMAGNWPLCRALSLQGKSLVGTSVAFPNDDIFNAMLERMGR